MLEMVCAKQLGTGDRFIRAAGSFHSKILSRRNFACWQSTRTAISLALGSFRAAYRRTLSRSCLQGGKIPGHREAVAGSDRIPLRLLDAEELLSAISGYGQKESGQI